MIFLFLYFIQLFDFIKYFIVLRAFYLLDSQVLLKIIIVVFFLFFLCVQRWILVWCFNRSFLRRFLWSLIWRWLLRREIRRRLFLAWFWSRGRFRHEILLIVTLFFWWFSKISNTFCSNIFFWTWLLLFSNLFKLSKHLLLILNLLIKIKLFIYFLSLSMLTIFIRRIRLGYLLFGCWRTLKRIV